MKKEKLEEIKRMLYLEDKISKLKSKYSINNFSDNALDMEKNLNFIFNKIILDEDETLSLEEREYFIRACLIPLEDIEKEIKKYDNSSPKMDEIQFIDDLSKKYNVEIFMVKRRIRDLRKIQKIDTNKQKFDVLAVPCKRAFVVSPDKTEEFLNVKPNPEIRRQQEEMAETFRKNILLEGEQELTISQKVLDYEFPKFKVTKELREDILKHPEKYADCDARIRMGMFRTDEEQQKYIEESLKIQLPGDKPKTKNLFRRKK